MIYLPFLNCFLLYLCLVDKQLLNKPYKFLLERFGPRLPVWLLKILGQCVICTATWLGIIEILSIYLWQVNCLHLPGYGLLILLIAYNAITTHILFKVATYEV